MKNFFQIVIILLGAVLAGCDKNEPPATSPDSPLPEAERTILVYAIAANNLSSNLDLDLKEMLTGMADIDMDRYRLFVCKVQLDPATNGPTPQELIMATGMSFGASWKTIKTYSDEYRSVDPARISEVLNDVRALSPSAEYGLIFWSHSDAWNPSPSYTLPPQRCFGQEKDGNQSYYCETPDLAAAIPDGWADFIWFDSCYMANIETAYEFRNKCSLFVGSTIELSSYGMPYDRTLPILFSDEGTVVDAVRTTHEYYQLQPNPNSMSVFDMSAIESVAEAARTVCTEFTPIANTTMLQRYSRSISPVLYDFNQYMTQLAEQNGTDVAPLHDALSRFVVYQSTTPFGWGGMSINPALHSGVSTHAYTATDSKGDTFYRDLAWYKRVYK